MEDKNYTSRVLNATPLQLVLITYELLLEDLQLALKSDDPSYIKRKLESANRFLSSLSESLNMDIPISVDLLSIYIYVSKLINLASVKITVNKISESNDKIKEADEILNLLFKSWRAIEKNEKDTDRNDDKSHQLFAGLTYKNGKLLEYIDEDSSREFKA